MADTSSIRAPRLTRVQWLVCIVASIGFAFDIYELLMLPLIVRPALMELIGAGQLSQTSPTVSPSMSD